MFAEGNLMVELEELGEPISEEDGSEELDGCEVPSGVHDPRF